MSAISGIEIALWDIKGQALNAPVYELLGGKVRDRIWTYGRWDGPTPELSIQNAMNHIEKGLTALKGDPFEHRGLFIDRQSEDLAIEKLKAVREAVGDIDHRSPHINKNRVGLYHHRDSRTSGAVCVSVLLHLLRRTERIGYPIANRHR